MRWSASRRTRVYRRVDNLLRLPQHGGHLLDLALFVCHDQVLRIFETVLPRQESPFRSTGTRVSRPGQGRRVRTLAGGNSPRICDARSMANATPIRAQVVLRLGQLPVAGYGGGHG